MMRMLVTSGAWLPLGSWRMPGLLSLATAFLASYWPKETACEICFIFVVCLREVWQRRPEGEREETRKCEIAP